MSAPARPILFLFVVAPMTLSAAPQLPPPPGLAEAAEAARDALRRKHPGEQVRIDRGAAQVARAWGARDGDASAFRAFVETEFIPRGETLDATFARLEVAFERLGGYLTSLGRDLRRGLDLEIGPMLPIDQRLGAWDVGAHVTDDLFANKTAFVVLLNFPLTTLAERLSEGPRWSRREWAEARLAQAFMARVPAEAKLASAEAYARADDYIASYNVYMHHVLTGQGDRLFPPGMRLISHWNLRDELKAQYSEKDGLPRQRLIRAVMERIVRQEIPAAVVDNPLLDWVVDRGEVRVSPVKDALPSAGASTEARAEREPDTRYARWLDVFAAERLADPYYPDDPSHIARQFNLRREIPEPAAKALFEDVLTSPLGARVGALVAKRLGRPLEPFDIWYAGFKPRAKYPEAELDAVTRKRYPTAEAFAKDIPRILEDVGFAAERARFLAEHIEVDPVRGAGHALGANRRDDNAHLRTRVGSDGMDYKGYNVAIHELGHNVEQVISLNLIDHTLLQGVPNTAITEALAFVFQSRDLALLGLAPPDPASEHLRVLEDFWATREIAGVALVDMAAWHWLYDHPQASPAELRAAVVTIAQDVWNLHFAPIFGERDVPLLAVYSHLISNGLYTPDYPLGHLVAFQLEQHVGAQAGPIGPEIERIYRQGAITPDAWMHGAVGAPLSAHPMLSAAERALAEVGG